MSETIVPQTPISCQYDTNNNKNSLDALTQERRDYVRSLAWHVTCERMAAREILAVSDRAIIEYCLLLDGEGTEDVEAVIDRLELAFDKIADIYAAENSKWKED